MIKTLTTKHFSEMFPGDIFIVSQTGTLVEKLLKLSYDDQRHFHFYVAFHTFLSMQETMITDTVYVRTIEGKKLFGQASTKYDVILSLRCTHR